jgi:two-component system, cell cycle sensor histidine kinase and response regulator CckA
VETILVVDDEPELCAVAQEMLEAGGYTVLAVTHPSEALRVAEQHSGPIHLLLSDVIMPEMHGPEVAARFRSLRPDSKILFMSAYTSEKFTDEGILPLGSSLIAKPFTGHELRVKVREVLDRRSPFTRPKPAPGSP